MRKFHSEDFDLHYAEAYEWYKKGDWEKAGAAFHDLSHRKPEDGPTKVLDNYINKQHKRKCPEWWEGTRPLTSK